VSNGSKMKGMHIRSEVMQLWWPTTQCLDIVEGPIEVVAEAVHAEVSRFGKRDANGIGTPRAPGWLDGIRSAMPTFLGGRRSAPWLGCTVAAAWETFPNLNAAFGTAPEFTNVPTFFLVLPTHSKWTVLWNNSFLCDGYDSLCFCLTENHHLTTVHWSAHDQTTTSQPGASFTHRKWANSSVDVRSVYVGQNDRRWLFDQYGSPLPEEDRGLYKAARKRDRFNEQRMAELLGRLGAYPWSEDFYALPERPCYLLRCTPLPPTLLRRTRDQVLH
jgi:hypothetical protein